jgi:hypothetical protein
MRSSTSIVIFALLSLGAPACSKEKEKDAKATTSPEDDKAKAEAKKAKAIEKAEKPSMAAFEKHRDAYDLCDRQRRAGVAMLAASMKSGSGKDDAMAKVAESRKCLDKWWDDIEKVLDKKDIPRDVWMEHYKTFNAAPKTFPIPKAKPIEKGQPLSLGESVSKTVFTLTAPGDWKKSANTENPKERADVETEGKHLYVVSKYTSEARTNEAELQWNLGSESTLHAQEYTVDEVSGVFHVSQFGGDTYFSWTAYRNVGSDGHGYEASVNLTYKYEGKPTAEQIQQFFDVLGTVKFQ